MPVRQKENIFVNTVHAKTRVALHYFKIQPSQKVSTAQGAAGVATLHTVYHSYNVPAYLGSYLPKFICLRHAGLFYFWQS